MACFGAPSSLRLAACPVCKAPPRVFSAPDGAVIVRCPAPPSGHRHVRLSAVSVEDQLNHGPGPAGLAAQITSRWKAASAR